ncbi:MAG: hypothetical protein V9F00_15405 [Nocardioides sp.]
MLMDHTLLVIDQVTNWMTNDFAIHDEHGAPIGTIATEGGLGSRLLAGNREFSVYDGEQKLLGLYDVPNFGFDTFEVTDGGGALIAQVTKELAFFTTRLTIELYAPSSDQSPDQAPDQASGPSVSQLVELSGDWLDYDFEATIGGARAAQVARRWPGAGEWFLGRNRYVVLFERGLPPQPRLGILGAIIALDLIREKRERSRKNNRR